MDAKKRKIRQLLKEFQENREENPRSTKGLVPLSREAQQLVIDLDLIDWKTRKEIAEMLNFPDFSYLVLRELVNEGRLEERRIKGKAYKSQFRRRSAQKTLPDISEITKLRKEIERQKRENESLQQELDDERANKYIESMRANLLPDVFRWAMKEMGRLPDYEA